MEGIAGGRMGSEDDGERCSGGRGMLDRVGRKRTTRCPEVINVG